MTPQQERMLKLAGSAAIAVALVLIYWAVRHHSLPGKILLAPSDRWVMATLGVAFWSLGFSFRRQAAAFGVLAFVFVAGGAAQLYLTEPLWYPAITLRPSGTREWMMVAAIGIEMAVALVAFLRLGPAWLLREASARLGLGKLAILLILGAVFSVSAMGYVARGAPVAYLAHVVAGGALIVTHLVILIAMSQVTCPVSGLHRMAPIVPATFAVIASLWMALFAFQGLPHVEDELAYLFQARTFASGALSVPAPPEAAQPGLEYYLMTVEGDRWYAVTTPGWPVALALGVLVGMPWLVNPLLAGVSVLLAHAIAQRKAGRDQADLVALMMASSPWLIASAGSMMTHTLTLALMLFAWWCVLRAADDPGRATRRLVLAGLAMGWVFATRPLDGVIVGGLTGAWILFGPGGSVARAAVYSAGCVVVGALTLLYNAHFTGSLLRTPLSAYLDREWGPGANAFGFGAKIGPPEGWAALDLWPGHGPVEGVINQLNNVASLQFDMLGWPVGSLALIYAFILWQRPVRWDWAMIAVSGTIIGAVFFYWFAGSFYFGPRYWFLAAFPFFYLSARGYDALRSRFPDDKDRVYVRIDTVLGLCCLFGLCVFTPWRGVTKYFEYGNYHANIRQAVADEQFQNSVVLVEKAGNIGSALVLNDIHLSGRDPIFLLDTGTLDEAALADAFPGKTIVHYAPNWIRRGPHRAN